MSIEAGLLAVLVAVLAAQLLLFGGHLASASGTVHRFVRGAPDSPPRRGVVVAAVVVGGVLRLLWVIWATRAPTEMRDPAEYLRIASDFGHGILPRFGGLDHSAYWPPGYPAVLAPFVAFADRTGWISPAFVASLVNVVAGTVTIALTALVAERWLGPRARNPAAWLVALCPALVFWTATAHTETVFTALLLGLVVLTASVVDTPSWRRWALVGLLVGAAFLVRSPAVIALVLPALTIRAERGSFAGAARATGLVALSAMVLLMPWAIRNGLQVGFWSPSSTNNAAAACFGHHDDAQGVWEPAELTRELQQDCYGGSPFDDRRLLPVYEAAGAATPPADAFGEPDEVRWYREAMGRAVAWAVSHPVEEVGLSVSKAWATWGDEGAVVDGARNYAEPGWAGRWHTPLSRVADLWLWLVGIVAVLGLALVPACRRATPVWAPIVLLTLAILGGVAEPHYRYPVLPLVAVLAAGFIARRTEAVSA